MMSIITLALAASVGGASVKPQLSYTLAQTPVADSIAVMTPDNYTKYIAVKKALFNFWQTEQKSDPEFFKKATATVVNHTVDFGGFKGAAGVYDYPTFIKQNSTLASIFTDNHTTPEEFTSLHIAALQAVGAMALADAGGPTPAATTTIGKNVVFLKPHRQELADVGVSVTVSTSGAGMGAGMGQGGDNSLNP